MPRRLVGVATIVSVTAALALPSMASAGTRAGERTFAQTFPVASHLCTEVAAGKRKHLVAVAATVLADCTTLQSSFTTAQTTVVTARTTLGAQISSDRHAIALACPNPTGKPNPPATAACVSTRSVQKAAIAALHAQLTAAVHTYYKSVESSRRTFWAAIKTLRPLRHAVADKPIRLHNT